MKNVKNNIALSATAILMLSSGAYAGKIITDADLSQKGSTGYVTEDKQFGFGGWNYDNVDIRIVDVADFSTALPGSEFNTTTGIYKADVDADISMDANMSFEADIKDAMGTVMGHLHGKDWPVGEPSGIKIINDDMQAANGKPTNCIMTSSYLPYQDMTDDTSGTGFLDAWPTEPNPVICSSPFQTHKRYKINLLPTTVETVDMDGYGKPVDLVFNLDPTDLDGNITRYQVLQKVNNYTGKRLNGYKLEVLDENGSVNPALTLSLGLGEGTNDEDVVDGTVDIWDESDMANMSHGLWGPIDQHFDAPGFFDSTRVYFPVTLNEANNTISYIGDMLGGNYQALFGNWLPSIWEPMGIFHDDDQNPETDGVLKAFLGVAPGFTERAWYKSEADITDPKHPVYTWSLATEADLATWSGDWYSEGPIEDVLNLGLNYIINVGENAKIGSTFTLRITPHVDTNQTPPSSYVSPIDSMDSNYTFAAAADFNDDGINDILWRHSITGEVVIWYVNSNGTHDEKSIGVSDITFKSEAADFNSDGIADILWRDPATGSVTIWYMESDGTYTEETMPPSGVTFDINAVADFNGDGITDVLWRDPVTGITGIWYIASDGTVTWKKLAPSGVGFNVEAAADFNNDGIADILWRNPITGITGVWYITSDGKVTWKKIASSGVTFNIEASADFNNDGIADILWRDPLTGDNLIWYMNSDGTYR